MKKNIMILTSAAGFALGAALMFNLTGCVGEVDADYAGPDDYVYYPGYGIYYNSGRHQYAYLNGDVWVMAPTPRGVSVDVLLASPSVKMDFHDSPERHHAEMMKRYPKEWTQHDDHQDRQDHQDKDHQDRK